MRVFLQDYGGYAFSAQLGGELTRCGYQVYYAYSKTTQLMQRFTDFIKPPNLVVEGISLESTFEKYNYLRRRQAELAHGRKVVERMRQFKPDVVLSANTPLDAQALIQTASNELSAGFVFWMQDAIGLATNQELSRQYSGLGKVIGNYYSHKERVLVSQSDQVVVISEDFLNLLESWGVKRERLHVIPNWAPLEEIPVLPKDNPWSVKHQLNDKFVFLFSGVLGLKHDASLFFELSRAFSAYPEVRVVVVAEGPVADRLKREKEISGLSNLVLLAYLPSGEYPYLLAASDVLLTVLKNGAGAYSVPSKVYSHLCAGRPQLLSVPAANPAARLINENNLGLVSEPGDLKTWLAQAAWFYQNRYTLKQMGLNARSYAEAHFAIQPIADQFEAILEQAARGR